MSGGAVHQRGYGLFWPFLRIFMPLMLLASVVSYAYLYLDQRYRLEQIRASTEGHLRLQAETVRLNFRTVVSDLMVLADLGHLYHFLNDPSGELRHHLEEEFLTVVSNKGLYDQVRFLDETGMEVVRANWNNGKPAIVAVSDLQNKGKRYYFKDAFILNKGEVFVSPLDLNIEHGKVERPLKPMIRFGTPVFDEKGVKRGIILINYLADGLLQQFKKAAAQVPGDVYLLNRESYWLASPEAKQEWGFMLSHRQYQRFSSFNESVWKLVLQSETGQFLVDTGLYTYATLYPLQEGQISSTGASKAYENSQTNLYKKDYFWKLISWVPNKHPLLDLIPNWGAYVAFYSLMMVFIAVVSGLLAFYHQRLADTVIALNAKVDELNKTREELVQNEKMASLGRMVAGFAHEVNTPIGVAVGSASHSLEALGQLESLFELDEVDEEDLKIQLDTLHEANSLVLSNLRRAADLVSSFKRTSVDQSSEQPRRFKFYEMIDDVFLSLHNRFKQTDISFDVQCSKELDIDGIPGIYSQIFTNLLMNSYIHGFDHGRNPGLIKIEVNLTEDDELSIKYCDNGSGMTEDVAQRVFEPFYTTGRAQEGSGLGLYICYNLVTRQLNGSIVVTSYPDKGVCFRIKHPVMSLNSGPSPHNENHT